MSLRDFLLILKARWLSVLLCTVVIVAAAMAVTMTKTPVYTAHATVYLAVEDNPEREANYVITSNDLNTYVAVLNSPSVIDPLRKDLGIPPGTPVSVSAEVADQASILEITARSPDPQQAAAIANAVGPQLASLGDTFSSLLAASGQTVQAIAVSPAAPPSSPTSPNVPQNLVLAILTGLLVGVGVAFARHALDTRVRGEDDVKALSTNPILGSIPFDKSSSSASLVTMETDPHGIHAEAIRRLRTNLMFVDVTTGGHSFVVTSSMPGEGKTTTAVNLGLAMADADSRVLLIDADLRNPSVARTMGIEGSVGLTTVLLGQAAHEDVIQQWRDTSLHVLPAGQIPPNPSELLGSTPMEELFAKLVHDYDFVLIDSPPVVPVIDAVILDKLTKGMLMVVGADRTRKRDLTSALRSLDTVDVSVSGFALNLVPTKGSDVYRYGYYRYEESETAGTRKGRRRQQGRRGARPRSRV